MNCKDCLIWRNKRDDLARQAIELVNYCCAEKLGIADKIAVDTRENFRQHILLMDNDCPSTNYCYLSR
jgi:hypothetical protein